ncbi:fatty acid desaturase family protein [Bacillus siamensis]|uniref:fatty acid desaturase family protein n=1 Tax=Bacillus siamensis TaxID=659243 RepID=UPI000C1904C2|nr:fatty acid desaturase family protein [Bacillus siamensis]MED0771242.1 fatty acid desaturase family protein [Bacillus siamensis]MED0774267.1 fatty acid desaturase family protein [Bacillus siamensis]MED0779201.1 fatty acid desaturase family protein [Bacillus siamensis]MED0833787.1 fatty acid desaturase family protein [Bacillus siamensis]PIK29852.1 fatty acid desaturase [Bacillus siamensis]
MSSVNSIFSQETRKKLTKLYKKNNWYNFLCIFFNWGVISSSIYLSMKTPNIWIYLLSITLIGSRMRGFDNLMHEASHKMLFKNKHLNKWVTCFFIAFPIFTSFTTYCKSHVLHHRFLWDPQKDPDTKRYELMGLDKPQKKMSTFLINHIIKPLTLLHVPKYIFGTLKVNLFSKEEPLSERIARLGFWATILVVIAVFNLWLELLLFWFVPLLTTFQIIRYWAEMAEHSGLKTDHPLYSSRNTLGNPIERFILHPHHDNYHLVHHLFPGIPHYNLKKAHIILMENQEYREAHHCMGFFKSFLPGFSSVIEDICGKFIFLRNK